MGESIENDCANEFSRFTTLVHNTLKTFSKMTKGLLPPRSSKRVFYNMPALICSNLHEVKFSQFLNVLMIDQI